MLIFLDETFRSKLKEDGSSVQFGALCGVAVPIASYSKIARDIFKLKLGVFGKEYAEVHEIKGKKILSPRTFRLLLEHPGEKQVNIEFAKSLIDILRKHKVTVFGCVCFDQEKMEFACADEKYLDNTYRNICTRINMFMKREHPDKKAIIVFDNRDIKTDERNAKALTNYFVRNQKGKNLASSILEIPMFAISQAHNVGLQVADFVTTIVGLHFEERKGAEELYALLHKRIYTWLDNYGRKMSTLTLLDPQRVSK